jgi:hypothetical protein
MNVAVGPILVQSSSARTLAVSKAADGLIFAASHEAAKNYETTRSEGPNVVAVRPVRIRFLN